MKKARMYIIIGLVVIILLFLILYKPKAPEQEAYDRYQSSVANELKTDTDSESKAQEPVPVTTTKWLCGFCDTLFSEGNLLPSFGARICPGCGDLRMTKGENWTWRAEFTLLPEGEKKQLDLEKLKSSTGAYEYAEMPLSIEKDVLFQQLHVDEESIRQNNPDVCTYSSVELFEFDGYELNTSLEFDPTEKLRSVSFYWTSNKIRADESYTNLSQILISQYGQPDTEVNTEYEVTSIRQDYVSKFMQWKVTIDHVESILQLTCFDGELSISYAIAD